MLMLWCTSPRNYEGARLSSHSFREELLFDIAVRMLVFLPITSEKVLCCIVVGALDVEP